MRFVLNKIDTLPAHERDDVIGDFSQRLTDDGIAGAEVVSASITHGTGVTGIEQLLAEEVGAKAAAVSRLEADLKAASAQLSSEGAAHGVSTRSRRALVEQLGHAAGVDATADLVAAQHRHDARRATGWPPARWVRRWGKAPIAALPRVGASPVATAEIATSLRAFGEDAADGLSAPWSAATRRTAQEGASETTTALTTVIASTARGLGPPRAGGRRWLPSSGC